MSDAAVWTVTRDGQQLQSAGAYWDRNSHDAGRWVITERRAEVHWTREV